MSIRNTQAHELAGRIGRVERKCDLILAEISALRQTLRPGREEIDEVIDSLHLTASAMRRQSQAQLRSCKRFFRKG